MPADPRRTWPGGLTRIVGWLVDILVVGAVSFALALPWLARMTAFPALARLDGLVVGLAYFGVLSSRLGGGGTLGMRLFGLKVITLDGELVSLPRSLARAAILIAPALANGWDVSTGVRLVDQATSWVATLALFGLGLAQLYLLAFNQPTGRLAHDILTRTAVVYRTARNWNAPPIRLHAAAAAVMVIIGVGAAHRLSGWLVKTAPARFISGPGPASVAALPEVMAASVSPPPPPTAAYAPDLAPIVTVRLKAWPRDFQSEVRRIAAAAYRTIPVHSGEDMRIVIISGFNTGFASRFHSASGDDIA